jgi:hypothetical protein
VRGADAVNRGAAGLMHIAGDIRTERAMPVTSADPPLMGPQIKNERKLAPGRPGRDDRLGESVRFGSRIRRLGEDWLYINDGRCIDSFEWPDS